MYSETENGMYSNLNIAVIGDVMLDLWMEAKEYKLSPEGPELDLLNPAWDYSLGGAGNVAKIVAGLGAAVSLFGVAGNGGDYQIEKHCKELDIKLYLPTEHRLTTQKERIVCAGRTICRISKEDTDWIQPNTASKLLKMLEEMQTDLDGIIIADYSKGIMCDMLIHGVMRIAKDSGIPVLVDPKDRLYIYKGCTIMKPNQKEYDNLAGATEEYEVLHRLDADHLVITSPEKIKWQSRGGFIEATGEVFAHDVEVANVSGCGDTVAAVLLLEYIKNGSDIASAVELANWAASRVVQQERTGHLTIKDLEEFADSPEAVASRNDKRGEARWN